MKILVGIIKDCTLVEKGVKKKEHSAGADEEDTRAESIYAHSQYMIINYEVY